jgi:tetratricopeptide (TPR) repeat protein
MHSVVAAVALAALSLPIGGAAHRKAEDGNRKYEEKAYDDALRAYTEAQVAAPEAPELHYDIGNVLYRQQNFEGAAEEFSRALLSAPPTLSPSVAYNLGNALYRMEKYDDAAKAYRRTLEAIPSDRDAKRNLELSLRAAEQKEQQKKNPQQKQDPKQEQNKDPKQQQQQKPSSGDDQRKDEKPKAPEPKPGENRKPSDKERQPAGGMSPEDARSLLDSLGEQEKAALRKKAERRVPQEEQGPEEDW